MILFDMHFADSQPLDRLLDPNRSIRARTNFVSHPHGLCKIGLQRLSLVLGRRSIRFRL
jgi:hypothetical protein